MKDAWTSGNIPWLDNSITLKDLHLSLFGALHQAIEGLMTDGAVQFCSGQNSLPACSLQDQQFRQVITDQGTCNKRTIVVLASLSLFNLLRSNLEFGSFILDT